MQGPAALGPTCGLLPLDALDQTTEWIRESMQEELLSPTPGAEQSSKPSLSPRLVLNSSYLRLLDWDFPKRDLPEVSPLSARACLS